MNRRISLPVAAFVAGSILLFLTGTDIARAEVLGMWNFNNRTSAGTALSLTNDYVPIPANGESGPDLERLFPTVPISDLENDFAPYSVGRETLRLNANTVNTSTTVGDPMRHQSYGIGSGLLPSSGSYTWEVVVAVHGFSGRATTAGGSQEGVIIDNSSGLWLGPGRIESKLGLTSLNLTDNTYTVFFDVPSADGSRNRVNVHVPSAPQRLNLDEYYHIAAVWNEDTKTERIYINEALAGTKTVAFFSTNRSTGFALGTTGPDVTYNNVALPTFHGNFNALAFSNDARGLGTFMLHEPGARWH